MPMDDDQLRRNLGTLKGHVTKEQLSGAKLFLRGCKVPHGDLENVEGLLGLHQAIRKNYRIFQGYDAVTVLQCALREVGVSVDKLKLLGSDERSLDALLQDKKLAALLLGLRRELRQAQFKDLKGLAQDCIDILPDNISTRDEFFHICLDQRVFEKEETLVEFEGWLQTVGRKDLAKKLDDYMYIEQRKQDASSSRRQTESETGTSEEEERSPHRPTFGRAQEESGHPQSQDLAVGSDPSYPIRQPADPANDRRVEQVEEDLERDGSTMEHEYAGLSVQNPSVQGGDDIESRDAYQPGQSETTRLLKSRNAGGNGDGHDNAGGHADGDNEANDSFCRKHRYKLVFGTMMSCGNFVAIILAIFFVVAYYHIHHVDTKPREVEVRQGDTVECGQQEWLVHNFHLTKNATADDTNPPYNVDLYSASDNDIESLYETRYWNYTEDTNFEPSSPRSSIPRANFIHVPYLMPGSTMTVSICLGSSYDSLNDAHLYVFNNRFASSDYISYDTNSSEEAVHHSSFKIGTNGHANCQSKLYNVTKNDSGYYRIVLEVPIGLTVNVNYTISTHIVYINSSNLTQATSCQTPCFVGFKSSLDTRTVLCTVRQSPLSSSTAFLIVEKSTIFSPRGTKFGGYISLFFALLACVVLLVVFIVYVYIHVVRNR